MEPFFIFCGALVLYCGYLTVIDLLNDLKKETASLPTRQRAVQRRGRSVSAGRRELSGRWGTGATGRFPLLSRNIA